MADAVDKLNLGCGPDIREGWTNMDGFHDDPRVVKHDMVRTPWPFQDGSFDHILASHVVEHTPLIYRDYKGVYRDVLFDLIEEAYRVLRPGGVFEILVPPALSRQSLQHVQHYRQFLPESFEYFAGNAIERYHDAGFELVEVGLHYSDVRERNPPLFPGWKLRGIPVFEHVRKRMPFLYYMVTRRGELRAILKKPR